MWMSSRRTHEASYLSYDSFTSRPKRDLLLSVARHRAVTLPWEAPLSQAQRPGRSVSRIEPSGVFLSRFCRSSSRALGPSLLLGQRSRMNLLSHHIRSVFHQDHRDSPPAFSRHRHNGHPGSQVARRGLANRAEKLPEFTVLTDRRPGSLDELTSQPSLCGVGDRSPLGSLSSGVLGGHQAQQPCQLKERMNPW